jgi:hypothetical protein
MVGGGSVGGALALLLRQNVMSYATSNIAQRKFGWRDSFIRRSPKSRTS